MNRVTLSGRLTKDPELRTTSGGKSVCSFNLAIDKKMSAEKRDAAKANGEPTADFPLCQVWGHDAEYLCSYGHKGSRVEIDGRISTRSYDDRDGRKVYVTEVVADEAYFVDGKNESTASAPPPSQYVPEQYTSGGFRQEGDGDEDLPF